MFRAFLLAAGLVLALGTLSTADAARSRPRTTGTEAAAASEAPRASSTRHSRRNSASSQRRNRGSASASRRNRGTQHASASTSSRRRARTPAAAPASVTD